MTKYCFGSLMYACDKIRFSIFIQIVLVVNTGFYDY